MVSGADKKTQYFVCNDFKECMMTFKIGEQIKTYKKEASKCKCGAPNLKVFLIPKKNRLS